MDNGIYIYWLKDMDVKNIGHGKYSWLKDL